MITVFRWLSLETTGPPGDFKKAWYSELRSVTTTTTTIRLSPYSSTMDCERLRFTETASDMAGISRSLCPCAETFPHLLCRWLHAGCCGSIPGETLICHFLTLSPFPSEGLCMYLYQRYRDMENSFLYALTHIASGSGLSHSHPTVSGETHQSCQTVMVTEINICSV